MSPSIRTLIDEFKNVVFAKVDLEYQDISTLRKLLPHLVNQNSKSDVEHIFMIFSNDLSASKKKLSIDTFKGK